MPEVTPVFEFLKTVPKYLTADRLLEKLQEQNLCMQSIWERSTHKPDGCDCHYAPGYIPSLELLAKNTALRNRLGNLGDIYDRIEAWQRDFYTKAATGSHGSEDYYRDAAAGLGIALQEIHRNRYDETSGAIWQEYQDAKAARRD